MENGPLIVDFPIKSGDFHRYFDITRGSIFQHQELERRTEMGLAMHNMLAKGQVVPFSMTLELLKGVANLTCSEKLVIQNCPQQLGTELRSELR